MEVRGKRTGTYEITDWAGRWHGIGTCRVVLGRAAVVCCPYTRGILARARGTGSPGGKNGGRGTAARDFVTSTRVITEIRNLVSSTGLLNRLKATRLRSRLDRPPARVQGGPNDRFLLFRPTPPPTITPSSSAGNVRFPAPTLIIGRNVDSSDSRRTSVRLSRRKAAVG